MARTVAEINQSIVTSLVSNASAVGITIDPTNWSRRNILRLICYTVAISINLLEQLMDQAVIRIESIIDVSAAGSAKWIQYQMFRFQYSATVPQELAWIDGYVDYPTIDPTLRIITACSVKPTITNNVLVKVAKGNPLEKLTSTELTAATSYVVTKGVAGISYSVISTDPDELFIEADVRYQGLYSSTIRTSVIAAITDFLFNLSQTNFDGAVKISDLEGVIRNVPGVNDVVLKNVRARRYDVLLVDASYLVQSQTLIQRLWNPYAGYIIPETTTDYTLNSTLLFIPE